MPDRIDLTNVTGIKYEPNISSCWTGSGTIVIQSSDKIMPEIRMRVGGAESVYASLREVRTHPDGCNRPSIDTVCLAAICACATAIADAVSLCVLC